MPKLILVVFALLLGGTAAADARSLALIIGNDSYASIPKLDKARADASGYAAFRVAKIEPSKVIRDV